MKLLKNLLTGIFILSLFGAMNSCSSQNRADETHQMHQSEAESGSNYVMVKSWEHQREIYIERGMTEAEADSKIEENLGYLSVMDRTAGDDRIGVEAPPFRFDGWLNTEPLTLEDLKGQVVLVRWWTDTCPFCASSAPALRTLHEEYSDSDFTLVGVFHPKAGMDDPLDTERVQCVVEAREFTFPVAIDWDWRIGTLKEWWLTGPRRQGTSVTFILDKSGVIRFIHPGMEYHDDNGSDQHAMCATDMGRIRAAIDQLIAE